LFLVAIFGISSITKVMAETKSQNYKITSVESTDVNNEGTPAAIINNYDLNWQGTVYVGSILPGNILYPVKMVRDRIWLWLTMGPLEKSELLLKFADKRLLTAEVLIEDNKFDLGVSTATKAEKYLERAIAQERIAKNAGRDTSAFLQKLSQATLKHQEILTGFEGKVSTSLKTDLKTALDLTQQGYLQVKSLLEK
jgi:hypothetical protein